MRPRTVLVVPAWYPSASAPLTGVFVRQHALAAAACGHRMVVVADDGPRPRLRRLFELTDEHDEALTIYRLGYRPSMARVAYVAGVLAVARRLAKAGTPVDLLHAHVHRMGWAALAAGAVLRRPVVISEHSSEWPRGMLSPGALRRARFAFRHAALVCPVDESLQHAIESRGVTARFRVVPNPVDTRVFHPATPSGARGPSRLVNVAIHVEIKAVDVLLRAFAALVAAQPQLTLELIGEGPLTSGLQRLAKDLDVDQRVRFTGGASTGAVAEALRAADVFVLASLSENLPVALLEALCSGLPVAATNVGGVSEAVGSDGRLAPPGDPHALSEAIGAVLDEYQRFDRGGIARRAAERWSVETVGRLWDEIYKSL